jgi:predicted O-methyltransferase YrrM
MILNRLLFPLWQRKRRIWTRKIESFHTQYLHRPAPLSECIQLQQQAARVLRNADPLMPPSVIRKGQCLRDSELADRLSGEDFGGWSPQIEQIDWLVDFLYAERPRTVLEFGSGRSTVCLCVMLNRIHGADGFRLLSLDQDPENVARATNRIDGLDGRSSCRVVHVPLTPAIVNDRSTFFYDIEKMDSGHFRWLGKADFVFIDAPYADGPCRYGTLPKVRSYLAPGARFVLDDALREKELTAGALWAQEGIVVEGVHTIGQGMMVGIVP